MKEEDKELMYGEIIPAIGAAIFTILIILAIYGLITMFSG